MVRPSPGSHPDGHAEHSQAQRLAAVLGHPGVGVGGVVHWGKDGWGRGRRQRSVGTTTLQVELPSGRPAQHSIALRKPCPAGRTCGDDVQLHGRELAIHQVLAGGVQVELQRLDCRGRIGGRTGRQGGKQGGRVRGWKVWLGEVRAEQVSVPRSAMAQKHRHLAPRWHGPGRRSLRRSPGTWRTVLPSAEPSKMACQVSSTTYGGGGAAGGMCHDTYHQP